MTSPIASCCPALYNLAHEGALPERFNLVGVARREMPDDEFREMARGAIEKFSRREPDATVLDGLLGRMHYVGFSFDDLPSYSRLSETLDRLDEDGGGKLNRNYYLSTAPEYFPVIVQARSRTRASTTTPTSTSAASSRSRSAPTCSPRCSCSRSSTTSSASSRSTASITTWARRPSRT